MIKLGIDIGGTKISIGFVDCNNQLIANKKLKVAEITDSKEPFKVIYDPSHPDADVDGYVTLPNVNVVEEMVGMISASRAYEANAAAAETTKSMLSAALRI